jgi:hypothetical protein
MLGRARRRTLANAARTRLNTCILCEFREF